MRLVMRKSVISLYTSSHSLLSIMRRDVCVRIKVKNLKLVRIKRRTVRNENR